MKNKLPLETPVWSI